MRDMVDSRATINVAPCYIICSTLAKGNSDAQTHLCREKTQRARLPVRPADHGDARPVGTALDLAHPVGTSRTVADVACAPRRLRPSLAHRAAGAIVGAAGGGTGRAPSRQRVLPYEYRPGIAGNLPAAAPLCRALE